MDIERLRNQCKRFFWCKSISDCQELLDIYIEFFFQVVLKHHDDKVDTDAEVDAKMIIQMMMTKALNLKNVLNGVDYISKTGKKLNNIIDPTIVASLIRNVYETAGMFNLIYRNTKSKEEREIIYLLWVHAGLSYRKRFHNIVTKEENKEKVEIEKKQIESIKEKIESNSLFLKLDDKNKRKIRTKLKEKDYLIKFENDQVVFLSWRELIETMNIKEGKLDHVYTYFSLYSHPSNVSVFQFADMFKKGREDYPNLVIFNLHIAFYMFSIFIADYLKLFPNILKTYEELDLVSQVVINFHNSVARSRDFDINEAWKKLG